MNRVEETCSECGGADVQIYGADGGVVRECRDCGHREGILP